MREKSKGNVRFHPSAKAQGFPAPEVYKGQFVPQKYDQLVRQRYRALLLVIKAKLESVESGVESFEDAFMAQIMLPTGETVGEWLSPQIEQIYATNQLPPLLPGGGR